jgi:hypothetical protein
VEIEVRFLLGAPFTYKTANISRAHCAACNYVSEGCFLADNADLPVIDFDARDYGAQVGLAGLGVAGSEFRAHKFGEGLNPLLQNYWMAIHPPTLYMGYVGFSVAFAFAVDLY